MKYHEQAGIFACDGTALVGITSVPEQAGRRGVLIVVGGPQYRVGSHRQFALLARSLAAQGIAAMRFDYRGMGDSAGAPRTFEDVDADLRAAIDHLLATVPAVQEVVIWGLCDAASAATFYAAHDARVCALVLLNPWVRTSGGHAKATLKHYYLERLLQPALWKKIVSGRFDYAGALRSLVRLLGAAGGVGAAAAPPPHGAGGGKNDDKNDDKNQPRGADSATAPAALAPLPERMLSGLTHFKGKVLLILSGRDLTAREFCDLASSSRQWRRLLGGSQITRRTLDEADHTCSRRVWRDQVAHWTCDWVTSW